MPVSVTKTTPVSSISRRWSTVEDQDGPMWRPIRVEDSYRRGEGGGGGGGGGGAGWGPDNPPPAPGAGGGAAGSPPPRARPPPPERSVGPLEAPPGAFRRDRGGVRRPRRCGPAQPFGVGVQLLRVEGDRLPRPAATAPGSPAGRDSECGLGGLED